MIKYRLNFDAEIPRNEWTHLCFTWESGSSHFYINGEPVKLDGSPPTGKVPLGGTLILGQEQDSVGGGFDQGDIYAGQADPNIDKLQPIFHINFMILYGNATLFTLCWLDVSKF